MQPGTLLVAGPEGAREAAAAAVDPARFQTLFADTLDQALAVLSRQRVDAALVAGVLVARALRAASPNLPIVLMDARFSDLEVARQECRAAAADSAVPLPVDRETLDLRVQEARLLAARRPPSPATPYPGTAAAPLATAEVPRAAPEAPGAAPGAPSHAWQAFRARVEDLYVRLDQLDYYQLLGVERGAAPARVKSAYYERASELHPDRFMTLPDEELKDRIYQVFKRISEAFKALCDPAVRAEYDAGLSGPERERHLRYVRVERPRKGPRDPLSIARTPAGRRFLQHALDAQRQGNAAQARSYLQMAAQSEPDNDDLRQKLQEAAAPPAPEG